ncbi:hypothetical protein KKE26_04840, partial [bacterium]|nr:hypothetical protein [bacterium]
MRILMFISLMMFISMSPSIVAAQDVSNREIINEITDLKIQVGKLETRVEEALKSVDSRMSDMMGLMHVILAGMIALV